jgi:hypothetical protein
MAAAGAAVSVALGVGAVAMVLESPDRIHVKLLLAAVVAPIVTGYYLLRALLDRATHER